MKKSVKVALIVAAVLIVAGIAIGVVPAVILKGDWNGLNFNNQFVEKTADFSGVRYIETETASYDVKFEASPDNELHVRWVDGKSFCFKVEQTGRSLKIEYVQNKTRWFESITLSIGVNTDVVVQVPTGKTEIAASTKSGSVALDDLTLAGELTVASSSGRIKINNVSLPGSLSTSSQSGDVELSGVSGENVNASTNSGRISLNGVDAKAGIKVDSSSGRTEITDSSCVSVDAESSSGEIELKRVSVSGGVALESTSGRIVMDALDCAELDIGTSSGEVKGTLVGSGWDFDTRTSSGSVRVPEDSGTKKARIETSSGGIRIEVTEK